MEILNNTVIIPAEASVDEGTSIFTLKVPGNVLFDLYSNGKRCICKYESEGASLIFEIISARLIRHSVYDYKFIAAVTAGNQTLNFVFESEDFEEPMYIVEES